MDPPPVGGGGVNDIDDYGGDAMSWDEAIRAFWYAMLFPGFWYLAMIALNQRQKMRCAIYASLAVFFLLLLIGLVLLRYWRPVPLLLHLNTGVVSWLGVMVLAQCTRYVRAWWCDHHRARAQRDRYVLIEEA